MSERRLHTAIALALLAAFGVVPSAQAQEVARRVGIVVTTAVNLEQQEAWRLSSELGKAIAGKLSVDVIAGEEVRRRLPPEGVPEGCVGNAECRNDLGKRLDAQELLLLVVVKVGDQIKIDPTWSNVASGETRSRDAILIGPGDDPASLFGAAAPKLLPEVEKKPKEGGPEIVVVSPAREDDGRHFTTGTWIASGIGAGALVGAVVFTFATRQKYQDLEDRGCRQMPLCSKGEIAGVKRRALAADLLYGASAAAGVTALVLYLRSGGGEKEAAPASPSIGPGPGGSAGLSVGGSF